MKRLIAFVESWIYQFKTKVKNVERGVFISIGYVKFLLLIIQLSSDAK